jgi:hypothetical protein
VLQSRIVIEHYIERITNVISTLPELNEGLFLTCDLFLKMPSVFFFV